MKIRIKTRMAGRILAPIIQTGNCPSEPRGEISQPRFSGLDTENPLGTFSFCEPKWERFTCLIHVSMHIGFFMCFLKLAPPWPVCRCPPRCSPPVPWLGLQWEPQSLQWSCGAETQKHSRHMTHEWHVRKCYMLTQSVLSRCTEHCKQVCNSAKLLNCINRVWGWLYVHWWAQTGASQHQGNFFGRMGFTQSCPFWLGKHSSLNSDNTKLNSPNN